MFFGTHNHTIDEKNRISIPAKFRPALQDPFIIGRGLDGCLFIYTQTQWNKLEEKIDSLPDFSNAASREFKRVFFSGASDAVLDKQGRVILPVHLKEYAGITKNVTIIGVSTHIELWDSERWLRYSNGGTGSENTIKNIENLNI